MVLARRKTAKAIHRSEPSIKSAVIFPSPSPNSCCFHSRAWSCSAKKGIAVTAPLCRRVFRFHGDTAPWLQRKSCTLGSRLPTKSTNQCPIMFAARSHRQMKKTARMAQKGQPVNLVNFGRKLVKDPRSRASDDHDLRWVDHSGSDE